MRFCAHISNKHLTEEQFAEHADISEVTQCTSEMRQIPGYANRAFYPHMVHFLLCLMLKMITALAKIHLSDT